MCARVHIEQEPNYTYVTARLLLDQLRSEALGFLEIKEVAFSNLSSSCANKTEEIKRKRNKRFLFIINKCYANVQRKK
mgnify:CR=1 FL=1